MHRARFEAESIAMRLELLHAEHGEDYFVVCRGSPVCS